jgi:hypothetical protein
MHRSGWVRRTGTGLLILALVTPLVSAVTIGSAAASMVTYNDPRATNTAIDARLRPQQVTATFSSTSSDISFTFKVAQATDPTSDPNWGSGHNTFVGWLIWTNGQNSGNPSFGAVGVNSGGQFKGGVGSITVAQGQITISVTCTNGVQVFL